MHVLLFLGRGPIWRSPNSCPPELSRVFSGICSDYMTMFAEMEVTRRDPGRSFPGLPSQLTKFHLQVSWLLFNEGIAGTQTLCRHWLPS